MSTSAQQITFKIGETARKLNVSVETIRMYERAGLLITEKTESGQRVFFPEDLEWLACIRRLIKEQGLNIEGIRRLAALMPCWEMRPCRSSERNACPAYQGALQPCWTMKERIPATCRAKSCRTCSVYHGATSCENLKRVIYHHEGLAARGTEEETK